MTITEILQRDHARLEDQAKHLRDANRSDPRHDFATFSEAISRHMFLEEHAILAFLTTENSCNYLDMPELLRQQTAVGRPSGARLRVALTTDAAQRQAPHRGPQRGREGGQALTRAPPWR